MKQKKEILKEYFESGKKPTEQQFAELIDSIQLQQDWHAINEIPNNEIKLTHIFGHFYNYDTNPSALTKYNITGELVPGSFARILINTSEITITSNTEIQIIQAGGDMFQPNTEMQLFIECVAPAKVFYFFKSLQICQSIREEHKNSAYYTNEVCLDDENQGVGVHLLN